MPLEYALALHTTETSHMLAASQLGQSNFFGSNSLSNAWRLPRRQVLRNDHVHTVLYMKLCNASSIVHVLIVVHCSRPLEASFLSTSCPNSSHALRGHLLTEQLPKHCHVPCVRTLVCDGDSPFETYGESGGTEARHSLSLALPVVGLVPLISRGSAQAFVLGALVVGKMRGRRPHRRAWGLVPLVDVCPSRSRQSVRYIRAAGLSPVFFLIIHPICPNAFHAFPYGVSSHHSKASSLSPMLAIKSVALQ